MTTTNSSGDYTFTDLPTGTYTISVSKPAILVPSAAGIDTTDITRLLTHLADPPNSTLTNCQERAADTSANGLINTTDLTNLLSYVALSSPTVNNHTGEWRFCKSGTTGPPGGSCSPTDLINLLSDTTGRDFDAILLGEISGDWTPAGPAPDAITTALGAGEGSTSVSTQAANKSNPVPNIVTPVPLTLPTTTVVAPIGAGFNVPVTIGTVTPSGGMQVTGFILQFTYDPAILSVQNPVFSTAGTLSSVIPDNNFFVNTSTPGVIRLGAGAGPGVSLTGSGTLINIKMVRNGAQGTHSDLNWDAANTQLDDAVNDSIIATAKNNGVLTMGPTVGTDTIGLYSPSTAAFFLRNSNDGGIADIAFTYGPAGIGFTPLVGDWDGNGVDTPGLYDPANAAFFLRNSNSGGIADISFTYGPAGLGLLPIVGDWNGDGVDTIGLYSPSSAAFFLRNSNTGGVADITFTYGPAGAGFKPLVGDWDGDGVDTIGLYSPANAAFFLRNSNSGGIADITFTYGPAGLGFIAITGDWNGDGSDTIGLYAPANAAFFLRNSNTGGVADITFTYGPAGLGLVPLVGNWDGL
jgi:hypothetical protein